MSGRLPFTERLHASSMSRGRRRFPQSTRTTSYRLQLSKAFEGEAIVYYLPPMYYRRPKARKYSSAASKEAILVFNYPIYTFNATPTKDINGPRFEKGRYHGMYNTRGAPSRAKRCRSQPSLNFP